MNTTQTIEQMRELRLNGMLQSYQAQMELSINHQLEGHELIAHLVEAEKLSKVITTINLNNGLPKQFFRKCNETFGDTFSFESD